MKIKNLFRFPVKSFTPEKKDSVDINDLGKIIGDRVGAFRLGEDSKGFEQWLKKTNYLSLMHVPYLSLIKIKFDESLEKIILTIPGSEAQEINISDKEKIENIISDFLKKNNFEKKFKFIFPNNNNTSFHDTKAGLVSLHSEESEKKLNNTISDVDGIRFRSNIIIEGCEAFEELSWIGKKITINGLIFTVEKSITRCAAVNCNPDQGFYDKNILKVLPNLNGIKEPSFGIKLKLLSKGGNININDSIMLN
ncbi:MAG: MOSC N-terminal beta barrel domain-containing protein [Chloroflexota bacterium]|nr:MOSC N-terminal beta barrel domain-containing protein [Chloroflexota bacterium]